ncbi:MAG: ECF transporter S component, partial [Bacilli bacterium]
MAKLTHLRLISVILFITVLLVATVENGHYTIVFSFVMLMLAMFPFFLRFEMKKTDARIVVLISILAAIAAIGRIPFAALPSIQPTSFVIIVTGLAFGAETGFMVGATAALVSNFFLGQGPWTPWQMFAWGMMGFTA